MKIFMTDLEFQALMALPKKSLVRIDIDSPPHMNPDGTKISRNHIHIFKETDNDTGNLPWAYDLETFKQIKFDKNNIVFVEVFSEFCKYCNINLNNVQGVI